MKHFFSLLRGWPVVLSILMWLAGPAARAQAPAWQSAVAIINTQAVGSDTQITAGAIDAIGNVYVVGGFRGTATFGGTTLTSVNNAYQDVFVAKWSPVTNSFVWAWQAGGTQGEAAIAIALSGTSIYITGDFYSTTATFGSTLLTNAGRTDVFVAKLTDAGTSAVVDWAQRAGGTSDDRATAVVVAGTNVFVSGSFGVSAAFGSTVLTSVGGDDAFVAKLVDAGTTSSFAWAQQAGGTLEERVFALAVAGPNIYLTGYFWSPAASFGSTTLSNAGNNDVFVAKLVDAGTNAAFAWALQAGGTSYEQGILIAVSGSDVYVAGSFSGTTATFGNTMLTNANSSATVLTEDVFITKLTDAGTSAGFSWANRLGGMNSESARGLLVNGTSVYVSGNFRSPTLTVGSTVLTNAGTNTSDAFVTKLTDAGTTSIFAWTKQAGGTSNESANMLATRGTTLNVLGGFSSNILFDNQTLANSNPYPAAFLASLTDPTLLATATAQSSLNFSLAPNPARTATTVLLPAVPGTLTATLILTDALGRTLRTQTVAQPAAGLRHELDLTGLAPGIYVLQVRAGSTSSTQRLVVE
jgi:hypothetical protein